MKAPAGLFLDHPELKTLLKAISRAVKEKVGEIHVAQLLIGTRAAVLRADTHLYTMN